MSISINGNGITSANIADGAITNADIADVAASKLTGALPAISGAALTNMPAAGKVLQVVTKIYGTKSATSTSGYFELFSQAITPISSSSRFIIDVNVTTGGLDYGFHIKEGSTVLATGVNTDASRGGDNVFGSMDSVAAGHSDDVTQFQGLYDIPNTTTAARTFTLYADTTTTRTFYINRNRDSATGFGVGHTFMKITEIGN